MKFSRDLDAEALAQVQAADKVLRDPARLQALKKCQLMDSPKIEAFDRIAKLAAMILGVPLTIISLVSDEKQFFLAGHGLPEPYDVSRSVPLDDSICRYTLADDPIVAGVASQDVLLASHPTTEPWGIEAFIAIPMKDHRGQVLGAFCAVDSKPHPWSADEIEIMTELTKTVMTEIRLREELGALEAEKLSRETLTAALTHDLRTPVAAARMASDALLETDIDEADKAQMIRIISQNMDRADSMIQDLLDASRLKAGETVPLEFRSADLGAIVEAAAETLKRLHGDRFEVVTTDHLIGAWDTDALQRMIENLGANAVKYGGTEKKICLSAISRGEQVELSVKNFGNPIAPENLKTIFERYTRTDSAERGPQKGWGIGLALVKGFTEAHGGTIALESTAERGTVFTMILPRDSRRFLEEKTLS